MPSIPEPPPPAPAPQPPPPPPPPDDHGDTVETGTAIKVPSTTEGNLERERDRDYFLFLLESPGTLSIETMGGTDTFGEVTLPRGDRRSDDDSGEGANFRIEFVAAASGEYSVVVRGSDGATGPYELVVTRPPPPPDDHGDTKETATDISLYEVHFGTIDSSTDLDYFRFQVESPGKLLIARTIDQGNGLTRFGELIHDSGLRRTDGGQYPNFTIVVPDAPVGEYFLIVRGGRGETGRYTVRIILDDHGGTEFWATPIALPASIQGELEYVGDGDRFRFQLDSPGSITIETTGETRNVGALYGPNGSVWRVAETGANFTISVDNAPAGEYHVVVTTTILAPETGPYTLQVTADMRHSLPALANVRWEVNEPPDYFVRGTRVRCGLEADGSPSPSLYVSWNPYRSEGTYEFDVRGVEGDLPDSWSRVGVISTEALRERHYRDRHLDEICFAVRKRLLPLTMDLRFRVVLDSGLASPYFTILDIEIPLDPGSAATRQGTQEIGEAITFSPARIRHR